jgi:molybdopterin/thiamine biosynthesis adenylyltransferase
MLTPEELQRYQRQIMIPGFGESGQEKLKNARIFLAGAGGLGSPAALYLAAAGVGTLRIVDSDSVDLSNLNRQVLHWTPDIGKIKVDSAGPKLRALNPDVKVETVCERMTEENIHDLIDGFDLIVDAVDTLSARYILNQAARKNGIPLFHGAVAGFEGRALTVLPGQTACLMCLYRGVDISRKTPVLGATPAVIASIQATEVIKYLTGMGQLLAGRFLVYDGLNMRFAEIEIARDPQCSCCGNP